MSFRFYSVPPWNPQETELVPEVNGDLKAALARVEYRGFKAHDRALELLTTKSPVVFASSPNDLPALLRTADQLLTIAKMDAGERAQVWRCTCGTPYAVPVALVRPVSLRCDRCGNTVEMDPSRATGEQQLSDPKTTGINATRNALSTFFREAMARGWPVLVARV
ncbi:MAG: hypothetical protein QM817_09615 [Archangium sp.]